VPLVQLGRLEDQTRNSDRVNAWITPVDEISTGGDRVISEVLNKSLDHDMASRLGRRLGTDSANMQPVQAHNGLDYVLHVEGRCETGRDDRLCDD
jgi:hypothetical protein